MAKAATASGVGPVDENFVTCKGIFDSFYVVYTYCRDLAHSVLGSVQLQGSVF